MNSDFKRKIVVMLNNGDSPRHIASTLNISRSSVYAVKREIDNSSYESPSDIDGNSVNYVPKQPDKFYHTKGTMSEHRIRR